MFWFWAWLVLACWFGAVCAGWWISTLRARAFARRFAPHDAPKERPVLIVRPCAGGEPGLFARLVSTGDVRTVRPVRLRIALATPLDPAFPIAEAAAERLREDGFDAAVVVTGGGGPNRKVAQLDAVVSAESQAGDLLCVVDSDVSLLRFDLDASCNLLEHDERLGAVWCPPVDACELRTLGDRASQATLNGSFHAFPLLAGIEPTALVGKTFIVRRDALDEVGGFGDLVDFLGEDFELSARLQTAGYRVEPSPILTTACLPERSFGDVVARIARWMTVVRAQRPLLMLSYPLFFFSASLIVPAGTVVATVATGFPARASAVVALCAMLTRVGLVFVARARCRQRVSILTAVIEAILGDLVILLAFFRAFRSRRFEWRGVPLAVDRRGRLVAVDDG